MFDLERQFRETHGIVASASQKLTAEQKQRDCFETHRHRVFSVSYYMTANEVEAEALLTKTFIDAFQASAEPDAQGVDCALLQSLEERFSLAPTTAATPDRGTELTRDCVRRTDLEEAVATLPPRERLLFLLRDVEGYSAAKIAGLLRTEESDVQKTLLSARIRMRNALARAKARNLEQCSEEAATYLATGS